MLWSVCTLQRVGNLLVNTELCAVTHKMLIIFSCDETLMFGNVKKRVKVHPCTGTEALYRPYGP